MSSDDTPRPRTLHLGKYHGLGNDFLVAVVAAPEAPALCSPVLAVSLCDRRRGVGADGYIVAALGPEPGIDAAMTLFNADGSRAEMSGNVIRCLAQAVAAHRGTRRCDLVVATAAGLRPMEVRPDPDDPATVQVRVGMGPVTDGPAWRPSDAARAAVHALQSAGRTGRVATADIGNPHLVIEVDEPSQVDVAGIGPLLEADFPAGVNVQFIAARPDRLELTVWERGAGVTEACGTGASAAATVAHRWGLVGPVTVVAMPGGTVEVRVESDETVLTGPATFVARVEVDLA